MHAKSPSPTVCLICRHRLLPPHGRPSSPRLPHLRLYTRPSIAPKPVLDIKHILRNPGLYSQNATDRNYKHAANHPWQILELARQRAQCQQSAKEGREAYNRVRGEIEQLQRRGHRDGEHAGEAREERLGGLLERAKAFKAEFAEVVEREREIEGQILELALALPNLSSTLTPTGEVPEVIEVHEGESRKRNEAGKSHVDIGVELDFLDFTGAATTSGWGWYYLKNGAALLEQALVQYSLSFLLERGWTIVTPPSIVYSHIAAACGFQPRDQNDEQQIYNIQQAEKDHAKPSLSLAATAEIPLAGLNAGRTLPEDELPLRTVAVSRCYRAEAGARGVDTKGLYRVHEFTKVEMFAWTKPDELSEQHFGTPGMSHSEAVFHEMVEIQKEILTSLDLTFRVLEMPTTDLGGPATRKRDIEVFFPSRKDKDEGWGEVTSTSICTDYQSRRLATRVKSKSGILDWPHTVNGTAMAVPRIIAAILETGWDKQQRSVHVPEVLRPWMGGLTYIGRKK